MKRIIFIVEDKESAQYRYRCHNVMAALSSEKEWSTKCYLTSEVISKDIDIQAGDIVLIERQTAKNNDMLNFIKYAYENRAKVLFDLDDLIFDYRDIPVLMKATNSKNIAYWLGYFWGIRRIAKKVDGFIVTNDFLGKKIKRTFGKPYKVVRNSLNDEQIKKGSKIKKKTDDKFVIGYFSGSPTHKNDFEMVQPQLVKFLKKHDDAVMVVVGYMEFNSEAKKMIDAGRIKVVELVDYLKLLELMSEADVNIAPLVISDFTNCKSELKFFEAAVVETTTIASPTYSFKQAIIDGKNGFLAKSEQWYDKIEYLYLHTAENKKIAKAARDYAIKNYSGKVFLKEVEEAYGSFAK